MNTACAYETERQNKKKLLGQPWPATITAPIYPPASAPVKPVTKAVTAPVQLPTSPSTCHKCVTVNLKLNGKKKVFFYIVQVNTLRQRKMLYQMQFTTAIATALPFAVAKVEGCIYK